MKTVFRILSLIVGGVLAVHLISSTIAQIAVDRTYGTYEFVTVPAGEMLPGTTLQFSGAEFAANSDDPYISSPRFIDTSTNSPVDFDPIEQNKELQNGILFDSVVVDETGPQLEAVALVVRIPPVASRGTFGSRLWDRLLHPDW